MITQRGVTTFLTRFFSDSDKKKRDLRHSGSQKAATVGLKTSDASSTSLDKKTTGSIHLKGSLDPQFARVLTLTTRVLDRTNM